MDGTKSPGARRVVRQAIEAAARVSRPRWEAAKLIPVAGWTLTVTLTAVNIALGLLPVGFIVATSVLLGQVPAAVTGGVDSAAWERMMLAFWLAAGAFLLQQLLAPVQAVIGELMARRVDGRVTRTLMRSSLSSPTVAPLEDEAVLDELSEASRELEHGFSSPGRACAGLLALIARYTQLAGCAVLIGVTFSWPLAGALVVATMLLRYGQRGGLRKFSQFGRLIAANRRRSDYLRELAASPSAGKEARVFGLTGWLTGRYREAYFSWVRPAWSERRRIYLRPYFGYAAAAMLAGAGVLASVGAEAGRDLPLTSLFITLQAVMAALRLGEFYPEADVPTQFGMRAYDAVRAFDRRVREWGGDDVTGEASGAGAGGGGGAEVVTPAAAIRFDNVFFAYPGSATPVFDNLNLTIPVGRSTAIVGVNGAGKTTLIKLLARLQEPTKGNVRVDDIDLRALAPEGWRRHIGVIFQDYLRYDLSAADNIGFGAVDHLDDRDGIRAAADAAGILTALEALPKGLDSPLARHLEGGADLSGGQWQRVAIARALFALRHGASILVLDEPTANLDVRAETQFYDEFVRLTEGVTTILVSHRFATVRHADNIVVLEEGRVLEQGTHGDLMRAGGRYAELFRLQSSRFAADAEVM